jgi:flagellar biosynthesis protein FlhB
MSDALSNTSLGMEWDEILSQFISLSCISVLSTLFGAKTSTERVRHLTYARLLVLFVYGSSWAFTSASTILVATNNYNQISCTLSILTCDVFYAGSKILIYAWYVLPFFRFIQFYTSVRFTTQLTLRNIFLGSLNVSGSYKP